MEKKYTYSYGKGTAISSVQMTEEEMINYLERSNLNKSNYNLFELVPVKMVPALGFKLERK